MPVLDSLQMMSGMLRMSSKGPAYGKKWQMRTIVDGKYGGGVVPSKSHAAQLVDEKTAAGMIPPHGVSTRTMVRYRKAGLLAYFRIRGRILYNTADIHAFIDSLRNPALAEYPNEPDREADRDGDDDTDGWLLLAAEEKRSK